MNNRAVVSQMLIDSSVVKNFKKVEYPEQLINDDFFYNELYFLSQICVEQSVLENLFNNLRIRDAMANLYNFFDFPQEIKKMWLQNIILLTSSLIEAVLYSALQNAKLIISEGRNRELKNNFKQILHLPEKQTYSNMIDICTRYGIVDLAASEMHKIRKLRNFVHLYISNENFLENEFLKTGIINNVYQLFSNLCQNVLTNLNYLVKKAGWKFDN